MWSDYLRERIGTAILFLLFACIFAVVFFLYALPLAAVGYGVLLCAVVGAVALGVDYSAYVKKNRALNRLMAMENKSPGDFAPGNTRTERAYVHMIGDLLAEKRRFVSEADRDKTEMTDYYTMWVHQIKTPIAAMKMIMQDPTLPEKQPLAMELFKIERYAEMVLEYLRIAGMCADIHFAPCRVDKLVKQAVRKYAPQFIYKKINVDIDIGNQTVITDEKWLVFVIEQLLSNALKYTETGQVRLYMESPTRLVVADSGIGVRAEDLPRIFERGFTGFNGRMDKNSTGLGLYLCKKVMDTLTHTIAIQSSPGAGTWVMLDMASDSTFIE